MQSSTSYTFSCRLSGYSCGLIGLFISSVLFVMKGGCLLGLYLPSPYKIDIRCPSGSPVSGSCGGLDLLHYPPGGNFSSLTVKATDGGFMNPRDYLMNLVLSVRPQQIYNNLGVDFNLTFEINTSLNGKEVDRLTKNGVFRCSPQQDCTIVFLFRYFLFYMPVVLVTTVAVSSEEI
jgi:hypothetical protein